MADKNNAHSRNSKSSTGPASFEILSDQTTSSTEAAAKPRSGNSLKWLAAIGLCAILIVGGVVVAATLGAEDDSSPDEDSVVSEEPAFQPYAGGAAAAEEDEQPRADEDDADSQGQGRQLVDSDLGEEPTLVETNSPTRRGHYEEADEEEREIIRDRDGNEMARWEAEERMRRELESVENVDEDFQRRLRRRDLERHSRVLQRAETTGRLEPTIQIDEEIQKQIQEHYDRERHGDVDGDLSVEEEDYRQDTSAYERDDYYHDDEAYYDENYDEDGNYIGPGRE